MRWAITLTIPLLALTVAPSAQQNISLEELPLGSTAGYDQLKSIVFSADSRHVAFLAVKDEKQFVIRDGAAIGPYEWVIPASLMLSPNTARVACVIQTGNDMSVVVDGQIVGKGYYRIGDDRIRFSDDGKHYAFSAQVANKGAVVVRDGVEGKVYAMAAAAPLFSPDGNHLAYSVALTSGKMCVVLDSVEQ
jgi:hypothetical protein